MSDARITIWPRARIDHINPELQGHFAEHLGRCIYDGVWQDETTEVDGFREDVVRLLEDLNIPVLRWPGGCFADDYHWEDGIGPREERPRRRNLFWVQGRQEIPEEPNAFGTDEFLELCERTGARPYLAVNVGSGDPQEGTDWVEYCNYEGDTELADRRRANGRKQPYEVSYWGLGNENWGCGGRMSPEQYAQKYRQFANYVGAMEGVAADQSLELIACGFHRHEWNRRFLEEIGRAQFDVQLDHLTLHHYYGATTSVAEAGPDQYEQMLAEALEIEDHIERMAAAIDAGAAGRDVDVIVDEWGAWHPEAVPENGLEQPGTVLDGLSAAAVLDVFNRHSDVLEMANIAQTVNVLQCLLETDGEEAWMTPTYRVYDLYAPHRGNEAVRTDLDVPVRELDGDLPLVSGSASVDSDEMYVTLSNLDCSDARSVEVEVAGWSAEVIDAKVLFAGRDPDTSVDAKNAEEFSAEGLEVYAGQDALTVNLEPTTVAGIYLQ